MGLPRAGPDRSRSGSAPRRRPRAARAQPLVAGPADGRGSSRGERRRPAKQRRRWRPWPSLARTPPLSCRGSRRIRCSPWSGCGCLPYVLRVGVLELERAANSRCNSRCNSCAMNRLQVVLKLVRMQGQTPIDHRRHIKPHQGQVCRLSSAGRCGASRRSPSSTCS